jgi:hypothetical protein
MSTMLRVVIAQKGITTIMSVDAQVVHTISTALAIEFSSQMLLLICKWQENECQRASDAFQCQDYYWQYYLSPHSQQQWTPQRSSPSPHNMSHDHVSRREDFRSPHGPSWYNEVTYSAVDRITPALQPSDLIGWALSIQINHIGT